MKNDDMNIDIEKLRKKLVASKFADGFMAKGIGLENCVNAYNANPEELISMARRMGIKLDDYIIKK